MALQFEFGLERNPNMRSFAGKAFRSVASLKVAIPLLVVTVAVTIAGSLQPDTDYYRTWWYLGLLGLNGLSLLFITILHVPSIVVKKGRNALIGVVLTHLGILILIAGAIYGGVSGFRHQLKAIEGEMLVVPGLPFVIRLDELIVEEYAPEDFAHVDPDMVPRKRQDSRLTLFRQGEPWQERVAAPGRPARVDGVTILPSINDIGWYFELVLTDPLGRQRTVPVRPWDPPLITVGNTPIMAHSLLEAGGMTAQIFTQEAGRMVTLGMVGAGRELELEGYTITLGAFRRYTGLQVYNRPHAPVLVAGSLAMLFGLLWHFYHRHRDRRRGTATGASEAG
jgi:hypothetical protein